MAIPALVFRAFGRAPDLAPEGSSMGLLYYRQRFSGSRSYYVLSHVTSYQ